MSEEELAQLQRQIQRERTARKEAERLLDEKSSALYRSNQQLQHEISERKQAAEKLRISALRHQLLFESSRDALMTLAPPSWKFTGANQATVQLFGASSVAEFTALGPWNVSPVRQPDGRPSAEKAQDAIAAAMREGHHFFEWEHQRLDGQPFPADVLLTRMEVGEDVFLQATVRDITERKAAEAKIQRMNRLFNLLSQCNQAVVRSVNQEELFQHVCRDAVQLGDFKLAWISLVDDAGKRVKPVASYGEGLEYLEEIQISVDADSPFGCGPTGTVIRENQPCWCQDFMHDPLTAPWHEGSARFGWGSSAALPLHRDGVAIGAFNLYSGAANAFDEDVRKLLVEMAMDISYALNHFAVEAERKRAEDTLRESEERYRSLFENMPVGYAYCQMLFEQDVPLDFIYLGVNDAFGKITGLKEVAGKKITELIPDIRASNPELFEIYGRVALTGQPEKFETYLKALGIWFSVTAYSQRKGYFVAVFDNITGRKKTDAELQGMLKAANQSRQVMLDMIEDQKRSEMVVRQLNAELEQKVLARTADLEQARHDAEAANQAKSAFLASMSHEIRTPMNGVIGMIDVLQQSSLTVPQMEMTNVIHDSAYSLLGIINDILDFSKIEAGKLQIDSLPMSVAEVMEMACETIDHMALKKNVELTLFTNPDIPAVVIGDAGRLRQILINLANNAIKFSSGPQRQGKVSVRAVLAESTAEQVTLEFRVTDNGIGMDEATQARLFTAFTQADSSTTRIYGGTGLGLAISGQLVNIMGGEITVQSEPGKGSLFSVRLPFKLAPDVGRMSVALSAEGDCRKALRFSDLQELPCLVVGEAESLADDLAAYLVHAGALVDRVADLAAAREWIAARPPGLCIVVIDDAGNTLATPLLDSLRAAARAHPEQETHFIVIGRGQRREPRLWDHDMVLVDGNVLTRKALLKAVAMALGRATELGREGESGNVMPGEVKAAPAPLSREEARQQGRLILIAEDNEINQKVILQQLKLLGQTADIANNGREALELWRSGDYAVLFADLHMPEMDGYELTTAIRAAETAANEINQTRETNQPRIPIIAFTANALKGEAEHCIAIGMDDYLSKPVQLVSLKAMLEKWLPVAAEATSTPDSQFLPPLRGKARMGVEQVEQQESRVSTPSLTLPLQRGGDLPIDDGHSITDRFVHTLETKAPPRSTEKLSQEFQIQQVELKMQNEELRQAQIALEESRDRYVDLYEFSPVGYLTLTDSGMIAEMNLTGATLLGVERAKLLQHRFDHFVVPEDRDRWHFLFVSAMQHESAAVNLALQRGDGSRFNAHVDCRRKETAQAKPVLRIAITDLSEREAASPLNEPLGVGEKTSRAEPGLQPLGRSQIVGASPAREEKNNRTQGVLLQQPAPVSLPVDVNVLKALVGDDEEIIRDFLHDFRLSAAKIAVELRAACAAGQAADAGALAHKLKSSARSVGALALGELCAEMEKSGKAGDMKALAALLPGFEQELAGVEGFLEGY